jgi:hypothetical protein
MMNDPVAQLKSKQSLGKLDSNPTGFWLFFHTFSLKDLSGSLRVVSSFA